MISVNMKLIINFDKSKILPMCYNNGQFLFYRGIIMRSGKGLLIVSLIAFVIPVLAITFQRDLIFKGVVATYEEAALNREEYRDQWISYEVIACLGEYAEETESTNFIPTGHTYYYACWMADGSIMPLCVSKKADKEYLDALTDATYDYIDEKTDMIEMEPRTFIGTVSGQKSEALKYYNEMLVYMGTTESDGWTVRQTLMDCSHTRIGTIGLCLVCLMIPILGVVGAVNAMRKEGKKPKNPEEMYLPR